MHNGAGRKEQMERFSVFEGCFLNMSGSRSLWDVLWVSELVSRQSDSPDVDRCEKQPTG